MHRTARLVLEPLDHSHAEGLVAALDDPLVGQYIGGPDVTTVEALHDRIDDLALGPRPEWPDQRWFNWVVRRAEDGVIIGRLEATEYPAGWAEIAYVFGTASWGRGYATEGVRWMVEHLRGARELHDIWAAVHPDNVGSLRVLERLGFERRTPPPARPLGSYDDGDVLFELPT